MKFLIVKYYYSFDEFFYYKYHVLNLNIIRKILIDELIIKIYTEKELISGLLSPKTVIEDEERIIGLPYGSLPAVYTNIFECTEDWQKYEEEFKRFSPT